MLTGPCGELFAPCADHGSGWWPGWARWTNGPPGSERCAERTAAEQAACFGCPPNGEWM